jgi:hypothetical protein
MTHHDQIGGVLFCSLYDHVFRLSLEYLDKNLRS